LVTWVASTLLLPSPTDLAGSAQPSKNVTTPGNVEDALVLQGKSPVPNQGSDEMEWRKWDVTEIQPLHTLVAPPRAARPMTVDLLLTTSLGETQLP
jgi:hypothetical protein